MNKHFFAVVIAVLLGVSGAHADDMPQVDHALYKKECGACHMAYQAGFLPQRSWQKMMTSLHDHFGENAELGANEQKAITDFLLANAAEKANNKLSNKILKGVAKDQTPLRISELKLFASEHHELTRRMVQDNPGVKSFSRCDSCHTKAATGSYSEREINIPGHGKWDD